MFSHGVSKEGSERMSLINIVLLWVVIVILVLLWVGILILAEIVYFSNEKKADAKMKENGKNDSD
jgi:hypothetical protein